MPVRQGQYELEIDLVHEGVLWFHDRGCEPVSFTVHVAEGEPGSIPPGGPSSRVVSTPATDTATIRTNIVVPDALDAGDPGEFPMHGVPLDTVAKMVAGHDGMLLHIDNDRGAGDDWVSYRYFVRAAV